jgi:hypothetical protein
MSGMAIQHKSSTPGEERMNLVPQNKKGRRLTATSSSQSGEGGIRTPGRVAPTPVFKTGAIDRSATSPGCAARES